MLAVIQDPKEYLPLLNELRRLPENYRQYKIDTHLKRYPKALVHLRKCTCNLSLEFVQIVQWGVVQSQVSHVKISKFVQVTRLRMYYTLIDADMRLHTEYYCSFFKYNLFMHGMCVLYVYFSIMCTTWAMLWWQLRCTTGEDKFDECLLFVEEHQLYAQALRLFTPDSDCFKVITPCTPPPFKVIILCTPPPFKVSTPCTPPQFKVLTPCTPPPFKVISLCTPPPFKVSWPAAICISIELYKIVQFSTEPLCAIWRVLVNVFALTID